MGKSQRLRFRDLRDVYLLLGECLEHRHSPGEWSRHLIEGACRTTGSLGGVCIELEGPSPCQSTATAIFTEWGFDSLAHRKHWLRYMTDGEFARNPLMPGMLSRAKPIAVCLRREVLPDRPWYCSVTYQEYMKQGGVDDGIACLALCGAGRSHAMGVHRLTGDAPLELRHRRKVQLLYREIVKRIGNELASWLGPHRSMLPPRARQVLALLHSGDSEKMIAVRLGISTHTVHDYVKLLYRHFGVHSRAELLAKLPR